MENGTEDISIASTSMVTFCEQVKEQCKQFDPKHCLYRMNQLNRSHYHQDCWYKKFIRFCQDCINSTTTEYITSTITTSIYNSTSTEHIEEKKCVNWQQCFIGCIYNIISAIYQTIACITESSCEDNIQNSNYTNIYKETQDYCYFNYQ